jgi:hypothetical protein
LAVVLSEESRYFASFKVSESKLFYDHDFNSIRVMPADDAQVIAKEPLGVQVNVV